MLRNKEKGARRTIGSCSNSRARGAPYRFGETVLPSPMPRIVATPHRMMPAHEVDAMAAVARADVDGFSVRGHACATRPIP
jgi:hypothetical protein